eukprot:1585395-Alexandrium_andersonii.AAC.1
MERASAVLKPKRRAGRDSNRRRALPRAIWRSSKICAGETPDGKTSAYNRHTASSSRLAYHRGNVLKKSP